MHTIAALLVLVLVSPPPALGAELGTPRDVVRAGVDRLVGLLEAARTRRADRGAEAPAELRRVFGEAATSLFDLDEMARRTLSQHWGARNAGERSEAAALVGRLLERSILRRIQVQSLDAASYHQVVDGEFATVLARLPGRPSDEGVEYRLYRKDGRWRVYDVVTRGFSFVAYYRGEFGRLMRSTSVRRLFEQVRQSLDVTGAESGPSQKDVAALLLPAFLEQASRRR